MELQKTNDNPLSLIEIALNKNDIDINTLERLLDLQERWEQNQARKAFNTAFAEFQKEKPKLVKSGKASFETRTGGITEYKYQELTTIQDAVDPILSKNGLSYSFKREDTEKEIKITCILRHTAGYSEENSLVAPADQSGSKNAIQAIGSTVTYLKRYTLENALGLSSHKDDDGHAATKPKVSEKDWFDLQVFLEDRKDKIPSNYFKSLSDIVNHKDEKNYLKTLNYLKSIK